jgi:hypothetical protein
VGDDSTVRALARLRVHLDVYAVERLAHDNHDLPHGVIRHEWLEAKHPQFEADPFQRAELVILAKKLLQVFEFNPPGWRAMRSLHQFPREEISSYDRFFAAWRGICLQDVQLTVDRIAALLST